VPRDLSKKAPWEAFPHIQRGSIGWRMGEGEEYWEKWMAWYRKLAAQSRRDYQDLHPEPSGTSWIGFYSYIDELESEGFYGYLKPVD
jgi:hypothetical protein